MPKKPTIARRRTSEIRVAVIVPISNIRQVAPAILPARFNSISAPSVVPIVRPELNSVTTPKQDQLS
jgi:hypothetical protein